VILDIAVIKKFRLGGSKHISNFENELQKMKPVFFKRLPVHVWHCLVGGDCTAETFNAEFKMQFTVLEVEELRIT
jgi:hypothetical protein